MKNEPYALPKNARLNQVIIGDTPYGKGVFASAAIKANRPIGKIEGRVMPPDYSSNYTMAYRDRSLEPEEPYRLVNHSCDPNCELVEWEVFDEQINKTFYELWIHSIRDIKKGEQLTIDYSWPAFNAIPCLCGSPQCRGWIVAPDELEKCIRKNGKGSLETEQEREERLAKKLKKAANPTAKKPAKKAAKKAASKSASKAESKAESKSASKAASKAAKSNSSDSDPAK